MLFMLNVGTSRFRRSIRQTILVFSGLLGLAGCAQLTPSGVLDDGVGDSRYRSERRFSAPEIAWPTDQWWLAYGDEQLNALIAEALRGSPDLAGAAARLRRAEAVAQVAGAAQAPQVSANASFTEQKLSTNYLTPKAMTPEGWQDYGQVTLDFRWEIDFWGKNRAALAAATSELEARRAEGAQARLILTTSIAAAYAELARLFSARELAARTVEVRSKSAALAAERFAHGLETKSGVRQSDARRAAAEGDVLTIDEQIGIQRNRLAALLGAGPDRGLEIERPQVRLSRDFGLPPRLALDLLGRRPDVVAARRQAEAQLLRIDQKRAEFYPNINLAAFVGVQSLGLNMLTKSGSEIGSIGPAISLPIFDAGRLRGELGSSQAAYAEAVANYERTVTRALQDVADVTVSQKALSAQLAKAQEGFEATSDSYRITHNRYEGGLANYLEALSAEDAQLASLRALTDLRSRALTLDVALMRAIGGGYAAPGK